MRRRRRWKWKFLSWGKSDPKPSSAFNVIRFRPDHDCTLQNYICKQQVYMYNCWSENGKGVRWDDSELRFTVGEEDMEKRLLMSRQICALPTVFTVLWFPESHQSSTKPHRRQVAPVKIFNDSYSFPKFPSTSDVIVVLPQGLQILDILDFSWKFISYHNKRKPAQSQTFLSFTVPVVTAERLNWVTRWLADIS